MEDFKSYISELRKELNQYVNLRMELMQLTIYEKSAKVVAAFASSMVMAFLGFFLMLFVFLALANWMGEILSSLAAGYGIVAGFYLIMLLIFMAVRKKYFEKPIIDKMIDVLMEDDDETKTKS